MCQVLGHKNGWFNAIVLKLDCTCRNHLDELLKQMRGSHLWILDSGGWGWGLGVCIGSWCCSGDHTSGTTCLRDWFSIPTEQQHQNCLWSFQTQPPPQRGCASAPLPDRLSSLVWHETWPFWYVLKSALVTFSSDSHLLPGLKPMAQCLQITPLEPSV